MATKDDCLSLKKRQIGFVDSGDQYSNLNLNNNQNHDCVFEEIFRPKNIAFDNKKSQNYDLSHSKDLRSETNSWNKFNKRSSTTFLNLSNDFEAKNESEKAKSANNSTLSLHIVAYENCTEVAANSHNRKRADERKWKNPKPSFTGSKDVIENLFEFPRQQENEKTKTPEVAQFKASQKLLNPNKSAFKMSQPPPPPPPPALQDTQGSPTQSTSTKENNNNNSKDAAKKDDNNDSQHDIHQNQKPMELANPEQHKEEIGVFKKLFLKIGQSVGTVKTSEFSEDYLTAVTEMDNYNAYLQYLMRSVIKIIQQNADFIPPPDKIGPSIRSGIDAPMGEDPYELLSKHLDDYSKASSHPKESHALAKISKNLANAHREYQNKCRKTFHQIRTFLNVDFDKIRVEREKVLSCRQQMDFAKHEMENSPQSTGKARGYEKAKKVYETQCQKVITIVKETSHKREKHQIEVVYLMQEMKSFHDIAAKECEKVRPVFDKLDAETLKLQAQNAAPLDESQK